ncbi:protein TIC 20-v, chloroplastic-like [Salvia hispanica]|uniref:protein TIC 20-v, chloroplastic-like n=1 Tax=Salvia hispanica TaxID=49212 RepID=UPI00200972BF|nr:protein TIC 20-v, chloroplastic-like [Salvia hispanica]
MSNVKRTTPRVVVEMRAMSAKSKESRKTTLQHAIDRKSLTLGFLLVLLGLPQRKTRKSNRFFDGVQYGKYILTQFTPFQALIQPLVPAIRVFKSFPFNGFLVFLTLYFVVVRNQNFSRYVRFNTMQAIVLDVLLIFPDLLERTFNPRDGVGLDVLMSLDSTVFLFLLVSLIYGSSACLLGNLPRLPIVAEAADRQVL